MLSHQLQRFAEHRLEGGSRLRGLGFSHGGLRGRPVAPQIDQRGKHVLFDIVSAGWALVDPPGALPAPNPSSLSFNSSTIRSAVFLPTPGMRTSSSTCPPRMASMMAAVARPDRTLMASVGPMPLTEISRSNSASLPGSGSRTAPAHPPERAYECAATLPRPHPGSAEKVEIGITTS